MGVPADVSNREVLENVLRQRDRELLRLFYVSKLKNLRQCAEKRNYESDAQQFLDKYNYKNGIRLRLESLTTLDPEPQRKEIASQNNYKRPGEALEGESDLKRQKGSLTKNDEIGNQRNLSKPQNSLTQTEPLRTLETTLPPEYSRVICDAYPTPIDQKHAFRDHLLQDIVATRNEQVEQYNSRNPNSKEQVYIVQKENVPSKVAHALPLAELRYMAQTLPLITLIPRAHKTLNSETLKNALNEARITVVSSRIEELRRVDLWSLRQPKRYVDSFDRNNTHHSYLLKEAKWLAEDFIEGKKYKISCCLAVSRAIMDYWTYGKVCCIRVTSSNCSNSNFQEDTEDAREIRQNLESIKAQNAKKAACIDSPLATSDNRIQVVCPKALENTFEPAKGNVMNNGVKEVQDTRSINLKVEDNEKSVSLNRSGNDDFQVEYETDIIEANSGNMLRDLEASNMAFCGNGISSTDALCDPILSTTDKDVPNLIKGEKSTSNQSLKLPVSCHEDFDVPYQINVNVDLEDLNKATGGILKDLPSYRGLDIDEKADNSVYDLPFVPISKSLVPLDDNHFYKLIEKQIVDDETSLYQLSKRRGMFASNRRNHYLRPPPVPSIKYLQNRTPTIWMPEDDHDLVRFINSYAYNWELISAHMIHRTTHLYLSNIERRTPWQCFERFVQLNEKFHFNELKGPRSHAAQQWLIEAHKFQQRQNRRISPLGVGHESIQRGHRRLRWASMFDAMRKCMKKRENAPRPNPAQPRKPLDCKNMKVATPAEMSRLKAQRDEALQRDLQLRKNVKNRLQQKQQQQNQVQQQQQQQKRALLSKQQKSMTKIRNGENADEKDTNVVSSKFSDVSKAGLTEKEVIEGYADEFMSTRPELTHHQALEVAETFYREEARKYQNQNQNNSKNPHESTRNWQDHALEITDRPSIKNIEATSSTGDSTHNGLINAKSHLSSSPNIESPTPQDILQRIQNR